MKNSIKRNLQGKKVFLLFVLTNLVYAFMLLVTIPKIMSFSKGLKIVDMLPMGYDLKYINKLFETLGTDGRAAYLYVQLPVDMMYPFLFAISNCLILGFFFKKIEKENSKLIYLCYLPVVAGVADYFENFGIIGMLYTYPEIPDYLAKLSTFFSVVKSGTTTVFFLVLLVVLVLTGFRFVSKKKD